MIERRCERLDIQQKVTGEDLTTSKEAFSFSKMNKTNFSILFDPVSFLHQIPSCLRISCLSRRALSFFSLSIKGISSFSAVQWNKPKENLGLSTTDSSIKSDLELKLVKLILKNWSVLQSSQISELCCSFTHIHLSPEEDLLWQLLDGSTTFFFTLHF